jgi:hypothetical protein
MRLASISLASLAPVLGFLVACGGSAPAGPDATIFCAKVIYDPCETEHDCADTMCETLVLSPRLQVCTQTCTGPSDTSCPMDNGVAVACGSDGFCQPAAATACQINP